MTTTTVDKPAFDLSSIAVEEAELPTPARRGRHAGPNPFTEALANSYEAFAAGKAPGRKVTVPGAAVPDVTYALRRAADSLGCGVRVVYTDAKGVEIKSGKNAKGEDENSTKRASRKAGNVTVMFAAKSRKAKKDTTADETPAPE